jgi:hypothetical protein
MMEQADLLKLFFHFNLVGGREKEEEVIACYRIRYVVVGASNYFKVG